MSEHDDKNLADKAKDKFEDAKNAVSKKYEDAKDKVEDKKDEAKDKMTNRKEQRKYEHKLLPGEYPTNAGPTLPSLDNRNVEDDNESK